MSEQEASKTAELEKAMFEYAGPDRVVHFTDFLLEKADSPKTHRIFKSSFDDFDKKLGSLQTGRVIVLSGHGKNGKTLFAESWIRGILKKTPDARAAIFSFEIGAEELLAKYVKDSEMPLYVPMQLETMNFEWLFKRCLEAKLKYDCRIVMIDHLHFMVDMATKQNMSLNIGAFMRQLKFSIATRLNMAVILIAHQEKGKDGEEASMRGARDSSFVGQECDAFVVVTRRKNFKETDFKEIESKRGPEAADSLRYELSQLETDPDDNYSHGLAIVKVECSRMSGVFNSRKLFRKNGDFLEEV